MESPASDASRPALQPLQETPFSGLSDKQRKTVAVRVSACGQKIALSGEPGGPQDDGALFPLPFGLGSYFKIPSLS